MIKNSTVTKNTVIVVAIVKKVTKIAKLITKDIEVINVNINQKITNRLMIMIITILRKDKAMKKRKQ